MNRSQVIMALCLVLCALPGTAGPVGAAPDTLIVQLKPQGAETSAFAVVPVGKDPVPAIVIVHEWWGMNGQIRGMARRFADLGYVTIVPDLYHGSVASDPEMAHELMRGLPEERALKDIDAAIVWLRSNPRVGSQRIGIVGFCMGGRIAELAALHSSEIAASVMFYGRPETDPRKLAGLKAVLQGHFGAADRGIGPEQVEALRAGLKKAGKGSAEIYTYSGAGHAFMNESQHSYHKDAANLAWVRTASFFQKHLKAK